MNPRLLRLAKRALLHVFYVAFAIKLLVPVGYMPTALGDGWPIKLCYSGLPANVLGDHGTHHDHDLDGEEDESAWEHCPLGALAAASGVPAEYLFHLLRARQGSSPAPYAGYSIANRVVGFRSRAPPRISIA